MEWRRKLSIPADDGHENGSITFCDLLPGLAVMYVDVRSRKIPDFQFLRPGASRRRHQKTESLQRLLFVNYAFDGRCELHLTGGELTYLEGGELAMDTGQASHANSNFYYPRASYRGTEIFIDPDQLKENVRIAGSERYSSDVLYEMTEKSPYPLFARADGRVTEEMELLRDDIVNGADRDLIILDVLRAMHCMNLMNYSDHLQRQFYSAAQVQIAKQTVQLISENLGKRNSAADLADRFHISETSLKNYFRGVYGCGYWEYQNKLRMEKAAAMLEETWDKVADIAAAVGFNSQSRFARAFGEYFGISPLEYRRKTAVQGSKDDAGKR